MGHAKAQAARLSRQFPRSGEASRGRGQQGESDASACTPVSSAAVAHCEPGLGRREGPPKSFPPPIFALPPLPRALRHAVCLALVEERDRDQGEVRQDRGPREASVQEHACDEEQRRHDQVEGTRNDRSSHVPARASVTLTASAFSSACRTPTSGRAGKGKTPLSGAFVKRMMGLEPTTFCMASVFGPSAY